MVQGGISRLASSFGCFWVIIGVRPEDVLLSKRRTAREFIKAEVYVTEPMGAELIVDLKVADGITKSKTSPDIRLYVGDEMWIGFNEDKIHVFDKATEKAII